MPGKGNFGTLAFQVWSILGESCTVKMQWRPWPWAIQVSQRKRGWCWWPSQSGRFQHWDKEASSFTLYPLGLWIPQYACNQSCCNFTKIPRLGLLPIPGHPDICLQTLYLSFHVHRVPPLQPPLSHLWLCQRLPLCPKQHFPWQRSQKRLCGVGQWQGAAGDHVSVLGEDWQHREELSLLFLHLHVSAPALGVSHLQLLKPHQLQSILKLINTLVWKLQQLSC